MTPFYIYLWGIADNINSAMGSISVIAFLGFCVTSFIFIVCPEDEYPSPDSKKVLEAARKMFFRFFLIGTFLFSAVPSSNAIACMVVIPAIANSQAIQKDFPELYQMAIEKLKQSMK